jgi:ABC-2 type transport system permease protein
MRIFHIARKELLQTFRDKRMLGILFAAPIFQLIVFGYAATYDINFIPTAVVDYSKSQKSRELITTMESSGYFHVLYNPNSTGGLIKLVTSGDAWCGVVIPERYEEYIKSGKTADVQVIMDGSNSNTAGIVASYLVRIVQQYSAELMTTKIQPVALSDSSLNAALIRPQVDARTRAWFNPDLSSHTYNIPAVLVMIMLVITMVLTSMAVVKEKELGTIEQISVTPIKSYELMIGKTMPFVMIGVVDILVVTTVAIFWFKVPFVGSIWFLLFSSFTFPGNRTADFHLLLYATAGHDDHISFHNALHYPFRLRISNFKYA